jgi:transposase
VKTIAMVYHEQLRWRAIVLHYCYSILVEDIAAILGCSSRSIWNWIKSFNKYGNVSGAKQRERSSRYNEEVLQFIRHFVETDPTFLIEELQDALNRKFPSLTNTSHSTILRALRHDLGLTRKVISKQAREAKRAETAAYFARLKSIYWFPDQLVFVDETSKDHRDTRRRYGWSRRGKRCISLQPNNRGKRISVLAALDVNGFFAFDSTPDTFDRAKFHEAMTTKILPFCNPYPLPRSIIIMDNAKIHVYEEIHKTVEAFGALLVFLPPYSPTLNPIEFSFSLVKRFLCKHCKYAWNIDPELCIDIALANVVVESYKQCFYHCGYRDVDLDFSHLHYADDEDLDDENE